MKSPFASAPWMCQKGIQPRCRQYRLRSIVHWKTKSIQHVGARQTAQYMQNLGRMHHGDISRTPNKSSALSTAQKNTRTHCATNQLAGNLASIELWLVGLWHGVLSCRKTALLPAYVGRTNCSNTQTHRSQVPCCLWDYRKCMAKRRRSWDKSGWKTRKTKIQKFARVPCTVWVVPVSVCHVCVRSVWLVGVNTSHTYHGCMPVAWSSHGDCNFQFNLLACILLKIMRVFKKLFLWQSGLLFHHNFLFIPNLGFRIAISSNWLKF